MSEFLKARANPLMKQLAALEASKLQYDQVTNVMPQLSAEISTMQWLYSVMNKGEGAMAVMNMNIAERAQGGGIEGVDFDPEPPMAPPARTRARIDDKYTFVDTPMPPASKKRQRYVNADGRLETINPVQVNLDLVAKKPEAFETMEQVRAQKEEAELAGPPKAQRNLVFETPTKTTDKMPEGRDEEIQPVSDDENEIQATPFKV